MKCWVRALVPFLMFSAATVGAADIPLSIDATYSGDGFYRYCPSVVDFGGVRHVFYCRNRNAYSVVDYIYHAIETSVVPEPACNHRRIANMVRITCRAGGVRR